MIDIKIARDVEDIKKISEIHIEVFKNFFLSFLGEKFLMIMYLEFLRDSNSGILIAKKDEIIIGFLAYTTNLSSLYKKMLKNNFIKLGCLSTIAFLKKPKVFFRLLRAFTYSKKAKRQEKYVNLSSIGSLPNKNGIGSLLISELKKKFESSEYKYIKLETDAIQNELVNKFYLKNDFVLVTEYYTPEKRKMNEYRYYL